MWFLFAVSSAFFESAKDIFSKKSIALHDEYVALWAQRFFAFFILTPFMFLFRPKVGAEFWPAILIAVTLSSFANVWFMKAIKYSALSMVIPIVSLMPIFTLFSSALVNREIPKPIGVLGIVVIVVGAYVLQFSKRKKHWLSPLTHLFTDKGSRFVLGATVLWSISSSYDKVAIVHSNAFFYAGMANIFYMITLLPFMLHRPERLKKMFSHTMQLAPIGFSQALKNIFLFLATPLTYVAYVGAVTRVSSVFSIAWGKFIFHEEKIPERLVGGLIIFFGVVLILFS